jgi:hypothetical protein
MASQVSVPPMRHASASPISRLRIELTGEPVSLRSIFVSHILNVATLQNKLSKLGTKAYQVQYREKNIKVRDGVDFHTYQLLRHTTVAQHFWTIQIRTLVPLDVDLNHRRLHSISSRLQYKIRKSRQVCVINN